MAVSLLVCGGRNFLDKARVFNVLDGLHKHLGIILIVHGNASGVDTLAEEWAKFREIDYRGYPAKWNTYGNNLARPLRNRHMITDQLVNYVLAFPGGVGTADMVKTAQEHFVPVLLG